MEFMWKFKVRRDDWKLLQNIYVVEEKSTDHRTFVPKARK